MQQEQQQQQASQQQVIVIQQPVMVNYRASRRAAPYMQRGVKFDNGCRCPGFIFITIGVVGFVFIYMGAMYFIIGEEMVGLGIFMGIAGAVMVITCCRLCHVARRDYNALPPDHPDRAKYSGIVTLPQQPTTTTYQLPPGAQIVGNPPASSGGQVVGYPPASSGGQFVGYPPTSSGGQVVGYPPASSGGQYVGYPSSPRGQVVGYPPSPAGQTRSVTPSAPIASAGYNTDDLPPSYEEINKNVPPYT